MRTSLIAACAVLLALPASAQPQADADRVAARIETLATFGTEPEGGVSRVAFSEHDVAARAWVVEQLHAAGMEVRVDASANIIGRRAGTEPGLKPIMFGSHVDSVPNGGNYDGQVGVVAALEVASLVEEHGLQTRHPLEVVIFIDEEGGLTGSRAMIGKLGERALTEMTHAGVTRGDGIRLLGGDPDRLEEAALEPGDLAAFIEVHIEQGANLADRGIDIGVVEGIVGIEWWDVTITGMANHAGTTPMNARNDALLAAARYVQAVNEVITLEPGAQVGTVGRISAVPGAHNVIPGVVHTTLEIRDLDRDKIWRMYERIRDRVADIEADSGTTFEFHLLDVSAIPAPMDPRVRGAISAAADELGLSTLSMPSGAGHDAQDMAQIAPTGMVFVPSQGGISHSPREFTHNKDIVNGANVLLGAVLRLDAGL
ncbi:MAG: Zn-dependent hydrolase [Rhodothermales bacterium]|nr:Zn-dependent hydrolase [Rhodothermales bacterium]MBO6779974.1 Zn-dependent hydrolase [Rhodothermales bacterium]